jgi:hypothetical protein
MTITWPGEGGSVVCHAASLQVRLGVLTTVFTAAVDAQARQDHPKATPTGKVALG